MVEVELEELFETNPILVLSVSEFLSSSYCVATKQSIEKIYEVASPTG